MNVRCNLPQSLMVHLQYISVASLAGALNIRQASQAHFEILHLSKETVQKAVVGFEMGVVPAVSTW